MNSLEELRDCVIADVIQHIKQMTREELESELIELMSKEIESLKHLNQIIEYGNKYKT